MADADGQRLSLALLDRSGIDSRELLQAQLARLLPVAAARLRATTGFEHTLVLWRHEAMTATMRFLEALTVQDKARSGLAGTAPPRCSSFQAERTWYPAIKRVRSRVGPSAGDWVDH
jgi:hypothetical protein